MRELGEVLLGSHLGVVARRDHPEVAGLLLRLKQFLHRELLLSRPPQASQPCRDPRETGVDAEVMQSHPTFWPVLKELEDQKRSMQETRKVWLQQAGVGSASRASSFLLGVRRKLAPTPVGTAWRLAKRARRELAHTRLGSAYRQFKRSTQTVLTWGRKRVASLSMGGVSAFKRAKRERNSAFSWAYDPIDRQREAVGVEDDVLGREPDLITRIR